MLPAENISCGMLRDAGFSEGQKNTKKKEKKKNKHGSRTRFLS
jgi:hypothetical protein